MLCQLSWGNRTPTVNSNIHLLPSPSLLLLFVLPHRVSYVEDSTDNNVLR